MSNLTGGEYDNAGGAGFDHLNNTMTYSYPDRKAHNSSLVGGASGNHHGHSSSKHMSELDIAKIVA